jgi:hypothetical protein
MKVISLLQPWASLVVIGAKQIETRSWNTNYRGPILIHASKKYTKEQRSLAIDFNGDYGAGLGLTNDLPVGQIIGSVNLIDTFSTERTYSGVGGIGFKVNHRIMEGEQTRLMTISFAEKAFGDYSNGRFCWLLSGPIQFKAGIPVNGKLGIWEYNGPISE